MVNECDIYNNVKCFLKNYVKKVDLNEILERIGRFSKCYLTTNVKYVKKDPCEGEYSSILEALNSLTRSLNTRTVIYVYPGIYEEGELNIPEDVYVVGMSMEGVIIKPTGNFNLFILNQNTGISFLTIDSVSDGFHAIYFNNAGDFALVHKVDISNSPNGIYANCLDRDSFVYLEYVSLVGATNYGFYGENMTSNALSISLESYYIYEESSEAVKIRGENSFLLISDAYFEGDNQGNAITVLEGAKCNINSVIISNYNFGIYLPEDGSSPELKASCFFSDITTYNLFIENERATGFFEGYSDYTKTIINNNNTFFITNKNRNIVIVAKKGGDFVSVKEAIDYINDNDINNQYDIYVSSGIYEEENIQMKEYINIIGLEAAIIEAALPGTLITLKINSSISNITLKSTNQPGNVLIGYDGGVFGDITMSGLTLSSSETLIKITSINGFVKIYIDDVTIDSNADFIYGIDISDDASSNLLYFLINEMVWGANILTNFDTLFKGNSLTTNFIPNIFIVINNVLTGGAILAPKGIGIQFEGNLFSYILNTSFGGFETGVLIPNTTLLAPYIVMNGCIFDMNSTKHLEILNPNTNGTINVSGQLSKINISSNNISTFINDLNDGLALTGQIYQGNIQSQVTNITEQIQHGSTLGVTYGGVISITGLNLSTTSGCGYVMLGVDPDDYLKFIEFSSQNITLNANQLNWIYIDSLGLLMSNIAMPNNIQNIILGAVKTNNTGIDFILRIPFIMDHLSTEIEKTLQNSIGPIFGEGCLATNPSSLNLNISSGTYYYGSTVFNPSSVNNITMIGYYNSGNNSINLTSVPLNYDNLGVLTAIPVNKWVKHLLALVGDGLDQKYLFVYGQELFDTLIDAENGNLPIAPSFFVGNVVEILGIVVTNGDTILPPERLRDIRPRIGFQSNTSTSTSNHNALLNLTVGDAHPQYFRTDGTRQMAGNIDLNGNSVINSLSYQVKENTLTYGINIQAPNTLTTNYNFTLPIDDGLNTQVLSTDGTGNTYWANTYLDPMTSIGDMVYRNNSNVTARLPIGNNSDVLRVINGNVQWSSPVIPLRDYIFFDDFTGNVPAGDTNWLSSTATSGLIRKNVGIFAGIPGNPIGVFEFLIGTGSGSRATIYRQTTVNEYQIVFGRGEFYCEMAIIFPNLPGVGNASVLRLGLGNSAATSNDNTNGIYFELNSAASGNFWRCRTVNNSAPTTITTASGLAINTWYRLGIAVNSAGTLATFTVNGSVVTTINTNIPTTNNSSPVLQYTRPSTGTTTLSVYIDYFYINYYLTSNRY